MKKIYIAILALLAASSIQAQNIDSLIKSRLAKKPGTKQVLLMQNLQLTSSIDSLQLIIDSLRSEKAAVEQAIVEEPEEDRPVLWQDQDPAVQDSLLRLWYDSSKALDFESIEEYDMDSVHFTSDVSDEEMIRRLKAMNASITLPFNETVKNYMVLYSEKIKSRTERAMGLSEYYFPIIEETFARYGLPLELKYLAIIESMLNPTATSRAGARGMWQFMYKTARGYGLYIDSYIDERLDVEKSVDAAARYLRDAYRVFGDWAIAISSYNCGPGNVIKAIRRSGGSGNFWDMYSFLPRETRGYMPAFVGAMYAFTYYREYGLQAAEVGMPVQTDTFEIRKKLHFRQINEVVGIPMEDISNLNPKYVKDIIPGTQNQPCVLRLPYKWSAAFMEANPDSLYGHRHKELIEDEIDLEGYGYADGKTAQQRRIAYKVKSGDSLGKIAVKNHTTVANLKKWNGLRSDSIRIGQILYIYKTVYVDAPKKEEPKPAPVQTAVPEVPETVPASADSIAMAPSDSLRAVPAAIDSLALAPSDSLSVSLADSLRAVPAAIDSASRFLYPEVNKASGDNAAAPSDTAKTTASSVSDTSKVSEMKPEYTVYTVKKGDTLFKIAKQFPGVLVSEIKLASGISSDSIRPGQKLNIPNK